MRSWVVLAALLVLAWWLLRRFGTVRAGAPIVTGKVGGAAGCRAGEIYRGGFCATPAYFAELDAS
jgi:hypothetical protein